MGAPLGNDNATKGKEWRNAIRRALAHKYGSASEGLLAVAAKLIDKAEEGDIAALKEIGDREDGKPAQSIGGDPEGSPVAMSVTWIRPKD
jgi:hypothetical protein